MNQSVNKVASIRNTDELSELRWVQIEVPVPQLE